MIYIVLGMHKSGTTLVSEILHKSGIDMGDFNPSVGYDGGNKYERLEPHDLNIEMLGYDYDEFSLNILRVVRSAGEVKPESINKIQKMVAECNSRYGDWGFKDPRTCLTYGVWKELVPEHKLVIIFRDPARLWEHYKPKNILKGVHSLFICWKAIRGWYLHNQELLRILETQPPNAFVLKYKDLMQDDRFFRALCEFTGRELKDSRNPELYRHREGKLDVRFVIMLFIQKWFLGRDVWKLYRELSVRALHFDAPAEGSG